MLAQFIHSAYLCGANLLINYDMDKQTIEKKPILPTISALEVDETTSFPVERFNVVRATAAQAGLAQHKTFKTNISDDRTVITVTRTA